MVDLLQARSFLTVLVARIRGMAWKFLINAGHQCRAAGLMRVHAGFQLITGRAEYSINIAEGFHARRWCSVVVDGGRLSIGRNFFMNNQSSINCLDSIKIGDDCLFGEGVSIYDHDHDLHSPGKIRDNDFRRSAVEIGNNVWLGTHVIVLRGSVIGDNVVVGANTVIKGLIPSDSIVINSKHSTHNLKTIERAYASRISQGI